MKSRPTTMFRTSARAVDVALRVIDLIALTVSFPVAHLVRDRVFGEKYFGHPGLYAIEQYWPLPVATLLLWIAASSALKLYRSDRLRSLASELVRVARTLVVVAATVAAIGFLMKQGAVSRLFGCFYFAAGASMLVINRLLLRSALGALRSRGYSKRIVAVVGTSKVASDIAEAIRARREWGYHFAGYIEDQGEPGPRRVGPLLGYVSKLEQILANEVLDEIIFAVSQERLADIEASVRLCTERGVTARVCLDLSRYELSKLSLDELNGFPLLDFR